MSEAKNRLKLTMIAAALPPKLDGIGDYTACLATELAQTIEVTILTAQGQHPAPIANVAIHPVFRTDEPRSVSGIADHLRANPPDWILLQYNPFSYGNRGYNPYLPKMLRQIKRQLPTTRLAVMMHETYVNIENIKFAVFTTWQRWQFRQLGRAADILFFSIDPWAQKYHPCFPNARIHHLPVGSNMPCPTLSHYQSRERLGIGEDVMVLGMFGTVHPSRLLGWVRNAALSVQSSGRDVLLLYLGPHDKQFRQQMHGIPVLAEGLLPSQELAWRFAALDIHLAPFSDGVSSRRTTFVTGLQQSVATLGTWGRSTDAALRRENGHSFVLTSADNEQDFCAEAVRIATDVDLRATLAHQGCRLYTEKFTWSHIGGQLLMYLE